MLSYINLSQKDYYENGFLKKDFNFTSVEADKETVATIMGGLVKLGFHLGRALIAAQFPTNKYRLPR